MRPTDGPTIGCRVGEREDCITEEALFVEESLASSLFGDQLGPFLSSVAQLSTWSHGRNNVKKPQPE